MITSNEDGHLIAVMTCPICGRMHSAEAATEKLKEALESHPQVCDSPSCQARQAEKNAAAERERELTIAKEKAAEELARRIEESNLQTYELGFDPNHPKANHALSSWMIRNVDCSVWIFGPTGRGKTRIVQNAARLALRDRSVRFWPAFDLSARLTETSKHPEAQLRDIYFADLLILDDLGIANMTEARLTALASIMDRRYIGWDQVRRAQGADRPTFGWSSYGRKRVLGGQLWITSQIPPEELVRKLSAVNSHDAAAIVRRLADMCVIHEAESVR